MYMKSFDFYEFAGLLVPGSITLTSVLLLFPQFHIPVLLSGLSVGDLGLFVVLAYAAGHLTQAVGNGVEWILWSVLGGMPTDWVRTRKHHLLSESQMKVLQNQLEAVLHIQTDIDAKHLTDTDWSSIRQQINAAVVAQSRDARINTFNGNYSLNRGIASAFLIPKFGPNERPHECEPEVCLILQPQL